MSETTYTMNLTGTQLDVLNGALSAAYVRWNTEAEENREAGDARSAEACETLRDRVMNLQTSLPVQDAWTRYRKDDYRLRGRQDAEAGKAPQPPHVGMTDRTLVSYRAAYWRGYKAALPTDDEEA